jgi:tetratricopeptide (TPR) repeat protein
MQEAIRSFGSSGLIAIRPEDDLSNQQTHHQYEQALAAIDDGNASTLDKVEMLMEIAMGLQMKPKHPEQLMDAISLYDRALELCPEEEILLRARIRARKATALQMVPSEEEGFLLQARDELQTALDVLMTAGLKEEIAEAQMNLGLILQSLAQARRAKITDAIDLYQRALRTFTKENFPAEYAILHNNLATAFLSMPMSDERAKMREALAVQSFEAALEVVTIEESPSEYAMLQNNLGNALQYVSSSHAVENNLRALDAYEEALKVRTEKSTPLPYATTIANKANCLRNLPDHLEHPEKGNQEKLLQARSLYQNAQRIFVAYGDNGKAAMLDEALAELNHELGDKSSADQGDRFGTSPI